MQDWDGQFLPGTLSQSVRGVPRTALWQTFERYSVKAPQGNSSQPHSQRRGSRTLADAGVALAGTGTWPRWWGQAGLVLKGSYDSAAALPEAALESPHECAEARARMGQGCFQGTNCPQRSGHGGPSVQNTPSRAGLQGACWVTGSGVTDATCA